MATLQTFKIKIEFPKLKRNGEQISKTGTNQTLNPRAKCSPVSPSPKRALTPDFLNLGVVPGRGITVGDSTGDILKNIFKTSGLLFSFQNEFKNLALNKSDIDFIHHDIRLYAFITLSRIESSIEGATFLMYAHRLRNHPTRGVSPDPFRRCDEWSRTVGPMRESFSHMWLGISTL